MSTNTWYPRYVEITNTTKNIIGLPLHTDERATNVNLEAKKRRWKAPILRLLIKVISHMDNLRNKKKRVE